MNDNDIMPFGKHKGVALVNVPADYLLWIYENLKLQPDLKTYIKNNMDVIKSQIKNK